MTPILFTVAVGFEHTVTFGELANLSSPHDFLTTCFPYYLRVRAIGICPMIERAMHDESI